MGCQGRYTTPLAPGDPKAANLAAKVMPGMDVAIKVYKTLKDSTKNRGVIQQKFQRQIEVLALSQEAIKGDIFNGDI